MKISAVADGELQVLVNEVEFVTKAGRTIGVATLAANQVRALSDLASVKKYRAALENVADIEPPEFDRIK